MFCFYCDLFFVISESGFIEFQEFINMMSTYPVNPDEEMLDAFKTFDKDNDGKISAEELRYIVKLVGDDRDKLTDKEVNDLLEQADLDGHGKINYEGKCCLNVLSLRVNVRLCQTSS